MILALLALASLSWGQSTPTANGFSSQQIDALQLSVNDLQSGRPTLTSVPTFQTGIKAASITFTTAGQGIKWQDGSQSTTAWTAPLNYLSSTTSGGFGATFNQALFGACVTTLTITTSGSSVAIWFSGSVQGNAAADVGLNVLQDGAYVTGYSNSIGITNGRVGSSIPANLSFFTVFPAPSAASHSYCLTMNNNGGTNTWNTAAAKLQFGVRETQ